MSALFLAAISSSERGRERERGRRIGGSERGIEQGRETITTADCGDAPHDDSQRKSQSGQAVEE